MIFELQAEARDGTGRTINRRLRKSGKVPAVVYGGGKNPQAIAIEHSDLVREMKQAAFYTSILTVKVGNEPQPVVVKDVQRHPFKPIVVHLDFQRVVADQMITLHVPLHFVGEDTAKGVKEQGGVMEHLATDVEISCLPRHLPEFIEVDVTQLEMNEILHLSDIKLPEGVTLVALEHEQDLPVITVSQPRREETDVGAEEAVETTVAPGSSESD